MTHFHFVKVQMILCTFTFKENSVVASKRLEQNKTQKQQQNSQTGEPRRPLILLEASCAEIQVHAHCVSRAGVVTQGGEAVPVHVLRKHLRMLYMTGREECRSQKVTLCCK